MQKRTCMPNVQHILPHSLHIHTHKHTYTALALETANQGKAALSSILLCLTYSSTAHHCKRQHSVPTTSACSSPPSLPPPARASLSAPPGQYSTSSCPDSSLCLYRVPSPTWLFCISTEGIICTYPVWLIRILTLFSCSMLRR